MLPWHRCYMQSRLSGPFCAFNADINLLRWIECGHRCKRVVYLGSEMLLRMWCSDNGYITPQCSLDLFFLSKCHPNSKENDQQFGPYGTIHLQQSMTNAHI